MKTINVKQLIDSVDIVKSGSYAKLIKPKLLGIDTYKLYGKKGLVLKVFKYDFWGPKNKTKGQPLLEASMIQNLFAYRGLAPRVLDIIKLVDKVGTYYAQVTELAEGNEGELFSPEDEQKYTDLVKEYQIHFSGDYNVKNYVGGKLVDFGYYNFSHKVRKEGNEDIYKKDIIKRVNTYADYGSRPESYQAVEELSIPSQRDMKHRIEVYKLEDEEFKGKSFIDLGSSSGTFCRYAARRGAIRIVGIEVSKELELVQYDLSNYLGPEYWNIDYYTINLNTKHTNDHDGVYNKLVELTGRKSFDIVLFLSMVQHVGFPEYIGKFCDGFFILEGNIAQHAPQFMYLMSDNFPRVENLGATHDHMARIVLKGVKSAKG